MTVGGNVLRVGGESTVGVGIIVIDASINTGNGTDSVDVHVAMYDDAITMVTEDEGGTV